MKTTIAHYQHWQFNNEMSMGLGPNHGYDSTKTHQTRNIETKTQTIKKKPFNSSRFYEIVMRVGDGNLDTIHIHFNVLATLFVAIVNVSYACVCVCVCVMCPCISCSLNDVH